MVISNDRDIKMNSVFVTIETDFPITSWQLNNGLRCHGNRSCLLSTKSFEYDLKSAVLTACETVTGNNFEAFVVSVHTLILISCKNYNWQRKSGLGWVWWARQDLSAVNIWRLVLELLLLKCRFLLIFVVLHN